MLAFFPCGSERLPVLLLALGALVAVLLPAGEGEEAERGPLAQTTIQLRLPVAGRYTLSIYGITGQLMRRFTGTASGTGVSITWNGKDQAGRSVTPGVYFYHVEAGQFTETRRMLLLR